jgi:hypothetical protein
MGTRLTRTNLNFQQAVAEFKKFLSSESISPNIAWIFQEDITWYRGNLFILWPLPKDNVRMAEKAYELGRQKGLGLKLEVCCWVTETPCCFVLVPEDEDTAESLMLTELRFNYPIKPRYKAKKVRFRWLWKFLTNRTLPQAVQDWLNFLPTRKLIVD